MPVQFPANSRVSDVVTQLANQGYTPEQIDSTLSRAQVRDGYLVNELRLDLQPAVVGAPAGLAPPPPSRATQATVAERAAKRNFLEKFADEQVGKGLATELKQKLSLGAGVSIEVSNRVLDKSTDPAQAAFLAADPEARVLTTSIKVSGDSDGRLSLGSTLTGNVKGAYEIQIELPFNDFAGTTWQEQLKHAKKRLEPVYELARLNSDHFWDEVKNLELPPGTRIQRTFDLGAGAKLGEGDLSADASRNTRVAFETRWTGAKEVAVTFDTLRTDTAGLGLTLGQVGATSRLDGTNHQVHTYANLALTGADAEATLGALKESVSWTNGLLPSRIDTDRLDTLRRGSHSLDVLTGSKNGATGYFPIGTTASVSAGGSVNLSERLTVSVPDHRADGAVVYDKEAREWVAALAANDTARLSERTIPGLVAQRIGTGQIAANLQVSLSKGAELLPGWVGIGAVLSFASNMSKEDVIGTKIEYKDENRADVTLWKIDTKQMARAYALEVGLTLDASVQQKIADALGEYILRGESLDKYADKIGEAAFKELKKFADKMKLRLSYSKASTAYGYESLRFTGFNLGVASDKASFEALTGTRQGPGDAAALALAIQNGRLTETVLRDREEKGATFEARFAGLNLLTVSSKDWKAGELQKVKLSEKMVDGKRVEEWLHIQLTSAGASRNKEGLTEKYSFDASAFAIAKVVVTDGVAAPPVGVDGMIRISHEAHDKAFYEVERKSLERAVSAGNFQISQQRVGDGGWFLGWMLGDRYGEVDINLKGVVNGVGTLNIIQSEPEVAGRTAVYTASRLRNSTLPPSEGLVVGSAIKTSLAEVLAGDSARPITEGTRLFQVLSDPWAPNLKPKKMAGVRKDVREKVAALAAGNEISAATFAEFQKLGDGQLDELIYRSVASGMLKRYRALNATSGNKDENEQNELSRLSSEYSFMTEAIDGKSRAIYDDLWIAEQGVAMRNVFERPELVKARKTLMNKEALDQTQIQPLVDDVFRGLAKNYRPAALVLDRDSDREALTFWVSLLTMAGRDQKGQPQGVGLFEVHGKEYDLMAASDGVDVKTLEQLLKRNGTAALDDARRSSGGPQTISNP